MGSVGRWWLYFHRSAEAGAQVIAGSADQGRMGRMGRSAYHLIHPVMVAGVIVAAAGDQLVLDQPGVVGSAPVSAMVLGGAALFLTGHALFKAVVWHTVSRARIAGVVALGLLGTVAPHVTALVLSICTALVVLAVATADYLTQHSGQPAMRGAA